MTLGAKGVLNINHGDKRSRGFTLVELLVVVAIMSILLGASTFAIRSGPSMGQVGNTLEAVLESARNAAMAHNTYVWVGFLPTTDSAGNPSGLTVAVVESVTGQSADLTNATNIRLVMKPQHIPSASLVAANSLGLSNMDTSSSDAIDVNDSTLSTTGFTIGVAGTPQTFTKIIQFSSRGETLAQTNLIQWINVGLTPTHGKKTDLAALQISGTTGEVQLFQP